MSDLSQEKYEGTTPFELQYKSVPNDPSYCFQAICVLLLWPISPS